MKFNKLYIILLTVLFLQSCLDEEQPINETDSNQAVKLVTVGSKTGRANYSFLSFKDMQTFQATIENLEATAEQLDDQFIASYPNLSGEALTDKEMQINFDHYRAHKDFLQQYGFTNSMINDYIQEESNWLNQQYLDETKDPDIRFLDLEPEELTMLNNDGVVQIGSDIFIQAQNGLITIPEGNTGVLFDFLNILDFSGVGPIGPINIGDIYGIDPNTFDWVPDPVSTTYNCSSNSRNRKWWSYSSTRKIKGLVRSHSGQWWGGNYLKSKTVYYRRYWFFGYHWIQTRSASLTAALDGTFAGSSCGDMYNHLFEDTNFKRKTNKYRVIYEISGDGPFEIAHQEMKGVHKKGDWRREHYLR